MGVFHLWWPRGWGTAYMANPFTDYWEVEKVKLRVNGKDHRINIWISSSESLTSHSIYSSSKGTQGWKTLTTNDSV